MFEKELPEWLAKGVKPPQDILNDGYTAGYKPPAEWENWFRNTVYEVLLEMRTKLNDADIESLSDHLTDTTIHFQKSDVSKSDVGLSNVDNVKQIPASEKGSSNGVATLSSSGNVPSSQLGNAFTSVSDLFVTGTYTGDGNSYQYIDVGFRPSAVLVSRSGVFSSISFTNGLAVSGGAVRVGSNDQYLLRVYNNGFRAYYGATDGTSATRALNNSGSVYHYIAFK